MATLPLPKVRPSSLFSLPKIRARPKTKYRLAAVFDIDRAYWAEFPEDDLREHCDHRSQFIVDTRIHYIIGSLVGACFGAVPFFAYSYFSTPEPNIQMAFLWAILGGVFGGLIGLAVGHTKRPRPFYIIKRQIVDEEGEEHVATSSWIHPKLVDPGWIPFQIVEPDDDNEEPHMIPVKTLEGAHGVITPAFRAGIYAASFKGGDFKGEFKQAGRTALEKLELGAVSIAVIAVVVLVFLFAMSGGE